MAKAKYVQQKNGLWQTKVWDGTYNANGTKHRISLYSKKSSADLEKKVNDLKRKVATGDIVLDNDVEFMKYCRMWRKTYKEVCSRNTQLMYDNVIEKHLIILHGKRLTEIRKIHFQEIINDAKDSPRLCQQVALTFRQIIRSAVSDQYLPANAYDMICRGVSVPRYKASEKRGLLPEEKDAIARADFTDQERAFVYILYGCGLRRGEALALTIFDIDFKRAEIAVNKALAFDGNNPYIKDTKSANGRRKVPMPEFLSEYLKGYIKSINRERLFTKQNGGMITQSAYTKMWASIVRKMNAAAGGTNDLKVIYDLTAHIFRHNYCTMLCYQIPDISLKRIAYLVGDDLNTVIAVYSHLAEEKKDVRETIQNAINL